MANICKLQYLEDSGGADEDEVGDDDGGDSRCDAAARVPVWTRDALRPTAVEDCHEATAGGQQ